MSSKVADLIDTPYGTHQIIPWHWLTSNAKKTIEVVFQLAFDGEQDFAHGFAIHHLRYVDINDVKAIKYLDFRHLLIAIEEIQRVTQSHQYQDLPTIDETVSFSTETTVDLFSIYDHLILKATNIDDLVEAILDRLDAATSMSERDKAVLCSRADWYTANPQTLDAIGQDYGLTRERIRQITKKYEAPLQEIIGEAQFAKELSRIAAQADSVEKFQELAVENLLISEDLLVVAQCKSIMQFLPNSKGWEGFSSQLVVWEKEEQELSDVARVLTKYRSKMGFIDIAYVAKELGFSLEKTTSAIKEKYPRFMKSRNLALARTEKLVSTFESSLAKQLLLNPSIQAAELLIGARRYAPLRNDSMPGEDADYINIIHLLCGNPPSPDNFENSQLYQTELSESDNWLINMFNSSPNGLLHRIEITKYGIESRVNLGSITAYCGSSPFIRMHSKGIYSLIGITPSADQVTTHAELALAQDNAVEIDLEHAGSNVWVTLKPNLNTYASGVLLPNRELKSLFTEFLFTPECSCGPIDSKQILRLSKEGFWKGFQSVFSHALQNHEYGTSSVFKIFFDFDQNKAIFYPQ